MELGVAYHQLRPHTAKDMPAVLTPSGTGPVGRQQRRRNSAATSRSEWQDCRPTDCGSRVAGASRVPPRHPASECGPARATLAGWGPWSGQMRRNGVATNSSGEAGAKRRWNGRDLRADAGAECRGTWVRETRHHGALPWHLYTARNGGHTKR